MPSRHLESAVTALLILNLSPKCSWVAGFTPLPFYSWYHWAGGLEPAWMLWGREKTLGLTDNQTILWSLSLQYSHYTHCTKSSVTRSDKYHVASCHFSTLRMGCVSYIKMQANINLQFKHSSQKQSHSLWILYVLLNSPMRVHGLPTSSFLIYHHTNMWWRI
jgi:hypothetical protein